MERPGMNLIEIGYEKAIEVLRKNATEFGFMASPYQHDDLWARDGAITSLGATLSGDLEAIECGRRTLLTLSDLQTELGQIPQTFRLKSKQITLYATDSSLWWLIAVADFYHNTGDQKFLRRIWPSAKKAVTWVQHQVIDTTGLINSPSAGDWMDSSIQREGKVFYNNVLFYEALVCANGLALAMGEAAFCDTDVLKEIINKVFWPSEPVRPELITGWEAGFYKDEIDPNRAYYLEYSSFENYGRRLDVAANCMAILWGLADQEKQERIFNYIDGHGLADPYPIRVIDPPIQGPDPSWHPTIDLTRPKDVQNSPYRYHNAGIWPWVGGFYVVALVKSGRDDVARRELEKLAQANRVGKEGKWEFNEWLHGKNGKPRGAIFQAWSASAYITAYKAVLEGKLPGELALNLAKVDLS